MFNFNVFMLKMKAQNTTGQQNNSGGNAPTFIPRKDKIYFKHMFIIGHTKENFNKNHIFMV